MSLESVALHKSFKKSFSTDISSFSVLCMLKLKLLYKHKGNKNASAL